MNKEIGERKEPNVAWGRKKAGKTCRLCLEKQVGQRLADETSTPLFKPCRFEPVEVNFRRGSIKSVHGCTSSLLPIDQGIPQGTIIGPILFPLFINDIPLHMQNSNIDIYADDATLTSCSKRNNISLVNNNIQRNLGNIQRWANMNKMVINGKKTKSVLVIGKRLRKRMNKDQHQDSDFTIALNNSQIERVRTQEVEIDDDS